MHAFTYTRVKEGMTAWRWFGGARAPPVPTPMLSAIGLAQGVRHCLMCVSLTVKAFLRVVNVVSSI